MKEPRFARPLIGFAFAGVFCLAVAAPRAALADNKAKTAVKRLIGAALTPEPVTATLVDVRYGPHERNVLDFYRAASDAPTPVLVCFHGGGFTSGDKGDYAATPIVRQCLTGGVSVVSANYRFVTTDPFPAPFLDAARAVQFVRSKAAEWNIDPERVAAHGASAGANMAMWLGARDDVADPDADDPVARQSTRLSCVVSVAGQSFNDPVMILEHIGGDPRIFRSMPQCLGVENYRDASRPGPRKRGRDCSAILHVTPDDPPMYLLYLTALTPTPLPPDTPMGHSIHHPRFGQMMKERLDAAGVEAVFVHPDNVVGQITPREFLLKHLGI